VAVAFLFCVLRPSVRVAVTSRRDVTRLVPRGRRAPTAIQLTIGRSPRRARHVRGWGRGAFEKKSGGHRTSRKMNCSSSLTYARSVSKLRFFRRFFTILQIFSRWGGRVCLKETLNSSPYTTRYNVFIRHTISTCTKMCLIASGRHRSTA